MSDYINREALIAEYDRAHQGPPGKARELIVNAPAADVREVVTCNRCSYYEKAEYENGTKSVCRLFNRQMQWNDFCSYVDKEEQT